MRPGWDEYFLGIAQAVSKRATCSRASVGCVIVNHDRRILTTGYNGAPAGLRHCDHKVLTVEKIGLEGVEHKTLDTIDGHCSRAQHAERNAVAQAAKSGIALNGATCYLTAAPCLECARLLVSAGIKHVIWIDTYRSANGVQDAAVELFKEARVAYNYVLSDRHDVG